MDNPTGSHAHLEDPDFISFLSGKIEELRKRLVDGSRRNPLINVPFRANSRTLLRFVDELPDVLRYRLSAGQEMLLTPLPALEQPLPDEETDAFLEALAAARYEDDVYNAELEAIDPDRKDAGDQEARAERALKDRVRETLGLPVRQTKDKPSLAAHARAHGVRPDYELPRPEETHDDGRHSDDLIQTLLLPDNLTRTAKSLSERARSYERETGVNVLQCIFGLLEWQPPGEAKPFVSPITQLEARVIRRQSPSGARFYVTGEGEPTLNTSMALKLEIEHGLELPEYDGGDVEAYFEEVADCAPSGWTWTVRREAAVGIFPSSKIAMYHDLDTDKTNVAKSPLVAKLLGTTASGIGGYAEDYEPDDPVTAKKAPYLVLDADASQFSAMVDVADGSSLAIEGPPGSGKSQTIVNIIASALRDGKKVLFVAEKLTALDVVKNRLESVGLGEFILPLQAGRSTSERVYEGLDARLDAVPAPSRSETDFESRRRHLEQERSKLQSYLDALSSPFESSGMTVHEVLGRAIATADARKELPRDLRRGLALRPMTGDEIETKLGVVDLFEDRLKRLEGASPIWRDARKVITSVDDADDLAELAGEVASAIQDFEQDFGGNPLSPCLSATTPLEEVLVGFKAMHGLAQGHYSPADLEPLLEAKAQREAKHLAGQLEELQGIKGRLARHLKSPEAEGVDRRLRRAADFAGREGGGKLSPSAHKQAASKAGYILAEAEPLRNEIATLPRHWRDGSQTLTAVRKCLLELFEHPEEARLSGQGLSREAGNMAAALEKRATDLQARLSRTQLELPKIDQNWTSVTKLDELVRSAAIIGDAGVLGRMSGTYKAARKFYEDALGGSKDVPRDQRAARMRSAASLLEDIKSFTDDRRAIETFGTLFDGLATDFSRLRAAVEASGVMQKLAEGSGEIVASIAGLRPDHFSRLLTNEPNRYLEQLFELPPSDIPGVVKEMSERSETEDRRAADAASHQELFLQIGDSDALELQYLDELVEDFARSVELSEAIVATDVWEFLPGLHASPDTASSHVAERLEAAQTLELLSDASQGLEMLATHGHAPVLSSLEDITAAANKVVRLSRDLAIALAVEPPADVWAAHANKTAYQSASSSPADLLECGRLVRSESELRDAGLGEFARWYREAGSERPDRPAFELARAAIAKAMADDAVSQHRGALEGYSGEDFDRIRETIAQRDRELVRLSQDVIRNSLLTSAKPPAGNGIGRKSTFTEMALINNELAKKKRRVGVRELTQRAGRALVELKPCWMMSPLAVAQYLHSGLSFDLLVVDEASQMTPENAVGALRRVEQAIVVGDTKQLPPTMFFNKVMQGEDTDEDLQEDSESVLDLANAAFSPIRQLRWHYRSKHSGLIRFSNHWMYDDNLTIFPAANEDDPKLGVSLKKVEGLYQSRTNLVEAEAVVRAVVQHMTNEPGLSLGVCTMNSDQKDLILEEFERERDRNRAVQRYMSIWEERQDGLEEFFVKNLETIQGDERDVMFISTLYGPERPGAPVMQRFGPINSAHGHRRLNVLFSRAKSRIVTFTSMNPGDIKVDVNKAKGVRMFRAWLEYSGSGLLPENTSAGGNTDSPFEDHVIRVIESLGYEAVPQVGVAGFRIDIGVRHPDWPYGFVLGVECDGATYHSSRSARDRDRLREEVLKSRGWTLHRIWSTDWFSNSPGERERLRAAIERHVAKLLRDRTDGPRATAQKRDKETIIEIDQPSKSALSTSNPQDDLFERTHPAEPSISVTQPKSSKINETTLRTVSVGDKVRLRKLDETGEEMMVTLSSSRNSPEEGVIGLETPLGAAILDAEEGDEVEYQVGAYIRKVEIVSFAPDA